MYTEQHWTKWDLFVVRDLSMLFPEIPPTIQAPLQSATVTVTKLCNV